MAHDPRDLLSINCLFFKDDPANVFTVEIPKSENVSILKQLVKEENLNRLVEVDALELALFKVSLPAIDVDSSTDSNGTAAMTRVCLWQPLAELKAVFSEPLEKSHVHIIIEHSPSKCPHR